MPGKTIQAPVGNPTGCNPVNQPADVLTVKWLLYNISESEGGPTGSLRAICDPNGPGNYNPALQQIILNFQLKQRAKGVNLQDEWFVGGRVKPGSITLKEMNRVASGSPAPKPDPSTYIIPVRTGPPTDWNPAPDPTAPLETENALLSFLKGLIGRRTDWKVSGGAGGGFALGPVALGGGNYSITRPDGSTFDLTGVTVGTGVGISPASFNFSKSDTPGAALTGVFSNNFRPLKDEDFEGGCISLSWSATFLGGAGVTIWFGGYGASLPGISALVTMIAGPIGVLVAILKTASVVAIFAGLQCGTPDAGVGISVGFADRPSNRPPRIPEPAGIYRGSI